MTDDMAEDAKDYCTSSSEGVKCVEAKKGHGNFIFPKVSTARAYEVKVSARRIFGCL